MTTTAAFGWGSSYLTATPAGEVNLSSAERFAVQQTLARYAFALDQHDLVALAGVLTEDATIEIQALHEPGKGPKGREEYTKYWDFYFGDAGPLPYVFQTSLDQKIEINGDEAVQYSNQLGIFQARNSPAMLSLSRRVNYLRRTPDGWRIYKTTGDSAFSSPLQELNGPLNPLPPMEQRTPWTYGGESPRDPMAPLKEGPAE